MFRAEHVPLILGILIALAGAALILDALRADRVRRFHERRRRKRTPRNRPGEALIGAGIIFFGASLMGGEHWRYATLAVLIGAALVIAGTILNRSYLKELLFFRGAARRTAEWETPPAPPPPEPGSRPRIR